MSTTVVIKEDLNWVQEMFLGLGIPALTMRQYNEPRLKTLLETCPNKESKNNVLDILEHCGMTGQPNSLTSKFRKEINT